eukprot:2159796-Prymnesium_polylepis.1
MLQLALAPSVWAAHRTEQSVDAARRSFGRLPIAAQLAPCDGGAAGRAAPGGPAPMPVLLDAVRAHAAAWRTTADARRGGTTGSPTDALPEVHAARLVGLE